MTCVPSSTSVPLKTGVFEVVAVTSTSLRTHLSTESTTLASRPSDSAHFLASALLAALSIENILTFLIEGSAVATPLTC